MSDQVNIKIVNMQERIDTLENLVYSQSITIQRLEEADVVKRNEIDTMKRIMSNYLMINIKPDGSHHGKEKK
mgnify:FL=1